MIKEARLKVGLTQYELGKILDVDTQFISNIEREIAPLPPKHIRTLSKVLKVPVQRFIDYNVERYIGRIKKQIGLR
jgi:transcriptional regulator with XRE-family HTH domain